MDREKIETLVDETLHTLQERGFTVAEACSFWEMLMDAILAANKENKKFTAFRYFPPENT